MKENLMPEPDPGGIEPGNYGPHSLCVSFFMCENKRHRMARAKRILHNLQHRYGWRCKECGEHVPLFRRADAVYCRESCRKKAARRRIENRL